MACFIVPVAEAVVTTVAAKMMRKKEAAETIDIRNAEEVYEKIPFSRKLHWLGNLLWGGSALLAFEHLWHGEITPAFPFLTAAANPAEMLHEMATVGVGMAVAVTLVWCVMLGISSTMEKKLTGTACGTTAEKAL